MRLFIAEKPSVARALAGELGRGFNKEGYIECGGDVVTWCVGHILEMAMPEAYDPKYKAWRAEDLPILPSVWKLLPKEGLKGQLATIGRLLKEATMVVNAGDPDREGQLLVDEVLEYFGNKKPVKRFWVSAQDSVSVQRGLNALKANEGFKGLADAAIARGRADWLIGMNLSRAFTLKAQRGGVKKVLSVGRVQTPTLALVVARDREIEAFKPKPYFLLNAAMKHENGGFKAKWIPEEGAKGLDSEGRLIDQTVADAVIARVKGKRGALELYQQEPKSEGPPKVWSLTSLTAAASARWGYSADDVLKGAQKLYEDKLASYPRTDCEFLPESQHADAQAVLAAVAWNKRDLAGLISKANPSRKSKVWNDEKITAHHGIIPTQHKAGSGLSLGKVEADLYELICLAYIAQFFPNHEYLSTKVVVLVGQDRFGATGKVVTHDGWKAVMRDPEPEPDDEKEVPQVLPQMAQMDPVLCEGLEASAKKTKPPSRFTEGTLLKAMENIHKFVEDAENKKLLKDGDGIGTPATRASILSELKRREFLVPKAKAIVSTPIGRSLIDELPDAVKSPVLTAVYERKLKEIEGGKETIESFLESQVEFVRSGIAEASEGSMSFEQGTVEKCPTCKDGTLRRIKGPKGFFWGCSRWKPEDGACKATFEDSRGKPVLKPKKGLVCPMCKEGELRKRTGANGAFWGCSRYPVCRCTANDVKGKPDFVKRPS